MVQKSHQSLANSVVLLCSSLALSFLQLFLFLDSRVPQRRACLSNLDVLEVCLVPWSPRAFLPFSVVANN